MGKRGGERGEAIIISHIIHIHVSLTYTRRPEYFLKGQFISESWLEASISIFTNDNLPFSEYKQ